jgi:phosphate uptake regulator
MNQPYISEKVRYELEARAESERNRKLGDICDAIRFSKHDLTSMDDDAFELANQTFRILNDEEDDKEGRIRDLYDARVLKLAEWILDDKGYYSGQLKRKLGL